MTRFRVLAAAALAAGLSLATGVLAQPSNLIPIRVKAKNLIRIRPSGVAAQPGVGAAGAAAELPVVPKSSAAFLSLKVSDVADHPDLKAALEQLKKTPGALDGFAEIFGVAPHEIDRVTLFWPAIGNRGVDEPIVVVTTREAYNEVRVLKTLRAEPVLGGDHGRGGFAPAHDFAVPKFASKSADFAIPKVAIPLPGPPIGPPGGSAAPPPAKQTRKEEGPTFPISATLPQEPLFYELRGGPFAMLFLVDERTLVFISQGSGSHFNMLALFAQLLQKKQTGPLADAIAAAGNHTLAGGVSLTALFREFERGLPRELAPYAALIAARTATITGDLAKTAKFTVSLAFDDAAAAKRAAPVLDEGLKTLAEQAAGYASNLKESRRHGEAALAPLLAAAASGMKNAAVKAEGTSVVATTEIDAGPVAAKAIADLLQSITSRKKFQARANNLKQIGLALHYYHDVNGKLPQNTYGPNGEPLLSWRVLLLPYLEEDNLYKQFKLDEAWDTPINKRLIEKMPKVFEVLGREAPKSQTFYQAFLTPDPNRPRAPGANQFFGRTWLIEGGKFRSTLATIPDGTSNTIGVVEARTSVVWSKPVDLPFGEKLPALGDEKETTCMVLMLDGSVRPIRTNIKPETLRILIDGQDGMVTPEGAFDDEPRRRSNGPGEGARSTPASRPLIK
ncbi:MAG TPA: DUF1559 domain-containing protein [Gemmata sp.]|nr:DUF1559 domain-containing protein [Gemmata sp.]